MSKHQLPTSPEIAVLLSRTSTMTETSQSTAWWDGGMTTYGTHCWTITSERQ